MRTSLLTAFALSFTVACATQPAPEIQSQGLAESAAQPDLDLPMIDGAPPVNDPRDRTGAGDWELNEAGSCGDVQHAFWLVVEKGDSVKSRLVMGDADLRCGDLINHEQKMDAARRDLTAAIEGAAPAQVCEALKTNLRAQADAQAELAPAGSCSLSGDLSDSEGSYTLEISDPDFLYGVAEGLGDCAEIKTVQTLLARLQRAQAHGPDNAPARPAQWVDSGAGAVQVLVYGDLLLVQGTGMELEPAGGGLATDLDFEVEAPRCVVHLPKD